MVRNYKKKTNRTDVSVSDMKIGIQVVLNGQLSEPRVSVSYNIKRGTLQTRIRKLKTKCSLEKLNRMFADDLNHKNDDNTVSYSSKYTLLNYGLTYKNIRVLAYDYAKLLKLKAPVQWKTNKVAGIEWLKGFMKRRNHEIRLRKPEDTSLAQIQTSRTKANDTVKYTAERNRTDEHITLHIRRYRLICSHDMYPYHATVNDSIRNKEREQGGTKKNNNNITTTEQ
ncbi:hypothetical protein MML48_1g10009 [Holotrichia oblita]|uniref:Uncharacterized protein n=1 Tax=Holotrichia oblita TaxID=644536 RepID=A0ACB9TY38_HOLOL|nr:hypothetical protein MML48_1g10009 [Holotrichia oblita]